MKEVKLQFICKNRVDSYGVSYGLLNSARFVLNALTANKCCEECDINGEVITVIDGNGVDREIYRYKPNFVFIEALWVTPEKMEVLLSRYPKVVFVVRVHSKAPFLANEGMAFDWLVNGYKKVSDKFDNFYIAANSLSLHNDIKSTIGLRCVYLPNIYHPIYSNVLSAKPENKDKNIIDIGCFGAVRPMKNHMNQAIAAVRFANNIGKRLRFHINGNRVEQKAESVMKNIVAYFSGLDHELLLHDWVPHNDFLKLVKTMDLGMQVSYSETFNIVAADFVSQNVPIVGGKDIEWMNWLYKADPNSTDDMVARLTIAKAGEKIGLQHLNRWNLNKFNNTSKEEWINFVC